MLWKCMHYVNSVIQLTLLKNTIGLYANNKYVPTLKDVQRICHLVTRPWPFDSCRALTTCSHWLWVFLFLFTLDSMGEKICLSSVWTCSTTIQKRFVKTNNYLRTYIMLIAAPYIKSSSIKFNRCQRYVELEP